MNLRARGIPELNLACAARQNLAVLINDPYGNRALVTLVFEGDGGKSDVEGLEAGCGLTRISE